MIRKVPAFSGRSRPNRRSSGSSSALEEPLHERLVDDRHGRGVLVVGLGEHAAAHQRDAQVLEVVRAHAIPRRARLFVHLGLGMSFDQNQLAPIVGERVVERQPGAADARQPIEALLEAPIQGRQLRLCIRGGRTVQRDCDATVNPIAEVLLLQFVQTARQHRRAGDQHHREGGLHDQQRLAGERRSVGC